MPASNKTKIQILRSTTATTIPSPSIMDVGEIAINTADRKLYSKHSDGTVFQVGSTGVAEATWSEVQSSFTAIPGGKYAINTLSIPNGEYLQVTLPASPSLGNEVAIIDIVGNFHNRPIQIKRNGENIMGLAEDMFNNSRYSAFALVYFDTVYGWRLREL